jgi:hypothetical protein
MKRTFAEDVPLLASSLTGAGATVCRGGAGLQFLACGASRGAGAARYGQGACGAKPTRLLARSKMTTAERWTGAPMIEANGKLDMLCVAP